MQKEYFSTRQAIFILMIFIFGSSMVMGGNSEAKQDTWIALLLAMAMTFPVVLIYARIMKLFPEKGLFDIAEIVIGKLGAKIIAIFMTWYAIHLASMVVRNFTEFIQIVAMPETPQLPLMIIIVLVVVYMIKSGVSTLGRWTIIILPVILMIVAFTIIFSLKSMEFSNILPVMESGIGVVAVGAYKLFTFPFLETVLFLTLAGSVRKKESPYKIYLGALLFGGFVMLLIVLRNVEILGSAILGSEYFPSYIAARIITVGDFLSRIEGTISMNFIIAGITKITVCLWAGVKGIAYLFQIKDEKQIVLPIGLLTISLCAIVYKNTMEMFAFLEVYQFYAIPFQMIIPLIIWIAGEFKVRRDKKNKAEVEERLTEIEATGGVPEGG